MGGGLRMSCVCRKGEVPRRRQFSRLELSPMGRPEAYPTNSAFANTFRHHFNAELGTRPLDHARAALSKVEGRNAEFKTQKQSSGRRPETLQPRPTAWVGGSHKVITPFRPPALKGRNNRARLFRPYRARASFAIPATWGDAPGWIVVQTGYMVDRIIRAHG